MARRSRVATFVTAGLVVALLFAFLVSPFASSQPDGLEKVAVDKGFADTATDHALADGPLADYAVEGIDDGRLSTGVAGVVGVGLCFAIGVGLAFGLRKLRSDDRPAPSPAAG